MKSLYTIINIGISGLIKAADFLKLVIYKKYSKNLIVIWIIGITISLCKKDKTDTIDVNAFVDPADANALTQIVVMPTGSNRLTVRCQLLQETYRHL